MPALAAADWTELVASTLENHEGTPVDQIFKRHPSLDLFIANAKSDSGREMVMNLEVADADETELTDRHGTFNTDKSPDHLGSAVYKWSTPYVGRIRLTWQDQEENQGKHQIVDLLESKVENVKKGHALTLAKGLHKPAGQLVDDGQKRDFLSFDALVSDTVAVGGIDPTEAGKEWWGAQVFTLKGHESHDDYMPIRKAFRHVRNRLSLATGNQAEVTHVICGLKVFEELEDSFDNGVRYVFDGSEAKDGQTQFRGIYDGNVEVRLDPDCPEDVAYFLDISTWSFKHLNDNVMKVKGDQVITGTFETVIPIASVLSLGTNQRRANAKMVRDYDDDGSA